VNRLIEALSWTVEAVLRLLDMVPATASLLAVSALTALLMLLAVRLASPQKLVARARDRIAACIYEMRLFLDAPGRLLRVQGRLLGWIAAYLLTLLPAAIVVSPALGLLYLHLETRHGLAPLPAPSAAVLRIELAPGFDGQQVQVAPVGPVRVTAPLVRAADESTVYARLAVEEAGEHIVLVSAGGERMAKRLDADPSARRVSPERRAGWRQLLALGDEPPHDGDAIRAVSVQHPERHHAWLGVAIPWWATWLAVSTVLALLLRGRFDVAL
jgi:hypothetical protein